MVSISSIPRSDHKFILTSSSLKLLQQAHQQQERTMTSTVTSSLQGLRIAVTGGTSGLGLALVEALHRRGSAVAFIARQAGRVSDVARRYAGTHGIAGD